MSLIRRFSDKEATNSVLCMYVPVFGNLRAEGKCCSHTSQTKIYKKSYVPTLFCMLEEARPYLAHCT